MEKCARCKTKGDRDKILKCPACGNSACAPCILAAAKASITCPSCKKPLIICPTCLKANSISRLKIDNLSCRKCGFKLK